MLSALRFEGFSFSKTAVNNGSTLYRRNQVKGKEIIEGSGALIIKMNCYFFSVQMIQFNIVFLLSDDTINYLNQSVVSEICALTIFSKHRGCCSNLLEQTTCTDVSQSPLVLTILVCFWMYKNNLFLNDEKEANTTKKNHR